MTKPEISPEPIMQVAAAFMASKFLLVGTQIGLFAALGDGPQGLDELARALACPARTIRILADGLVALGFLTKESGAWANTPVAQTYLAGKTPADLRPFLKFWDRLSFKAWQGLETAVRTGEAQRKGDFGPEEQQLFNEGVAAITTGTALALAAAVDWSRHAKVLDLGGGTGNFLQALVRAQPRLSATLLDLPGAAAVARRVLKGTPGAERIAIVDGDMIEGAIPGGHDAILMANVLHGFSPAHNELVLGKARRASAAGTRLYAVDFWLDAEKTQPTFGALISGEFLIMTGEGESYAEADLAAWAAKTGWAIVERRPLVGPASVVVCEAR